MNDNYIKRIIALGEDFFKDWNWQEGDRYVALEHNCHNFTNPEWTTGYCSDDCFPQWKCASCKGNYYIKWIPLPNLNQLSNMYDPDWKKAYSRFMSWYYDRDYPFGLCYTCPEDMWLDMVVRKRTGMSWDTESSSWKR